MDRLQISGTEVRPSPSVTFSRPFVLDCGKVLDELVVAYRTYGTLNPARSNAVLVCHALTGDQQVAELEPSTGRRGWWDKVVGPGLPVDTDRFYVICANVLGGCMGSTGPGTIRPGTGERWGSDFPAITIRDMVRAQKWLVRHLGIERLFAVIGGSMGGMQALQWAAAYPDMVFAAMPIATGPFHSAQNIAFHEIARQAISADPDFHAGRYWAFGTVPARGLAVARMMAHITYLSDDALTRKFGRRLQYAPEAEVTPGRPLLGDMFQVQSYLRHQGSRFVERFDANSYLAITRAMDLFDLGAEHGGDLSGPFRGTSTRFCLASFTSDWLFPTVQSRMIARALVHAGANVSFVEIVSDKGHDAFLLDEPDLLRTVAGFLEGSAHHAGLE
jgi:homoserine O-acetyltransferase/O-succinyltransferase